MDANALTVTTCLIILHQTLHIQRQYSHHQSQNQPESDDNSELDREVNDIMMDVFGDCDIHNLSNMEDYILYYLVQDYIYFCASFSALL